MIRKITPVAALLAIFAGLTHIYDGWTAGAVIGGIIWLDLTLEGLTRRDGTK